MGTRLVFIRFLFIKSVEAPTVDFPDPGGPAITIRTLFWFERPYVF